MKPLSAELLSVAMATATEEHYRRSYKREATLI